MLSGCTLRASFSTSKSRASIGSGILVYVVERAKCSKAACRIIHEIDCAGRLKTNHMQPVDWRTIAFDQMLQLWRKLIIVLSQASHADFIQMMTRWMRQQGCDWWADASTNHDIRHGSATTPAMSKNDKCN